MSHNISVATMNIHTRLNIAVLTPDLLQWNQIHRWFEASDLHSEHFTSTAHLLSALRLSRFDAILMNWDTADHDRIALLTNLRVRMRLKLPVLACTQSAGPHLWKALECGATDFVITPTTCTNLVTRLRVTMVERIATRKQQKTMDIRLSPNDFSVTVSRKRVRLTPREFGVFRVLHRYMGSTVPREHILDDVWGDGRSDTARRVDIHVSRIRNKLFAGTSPQWKIDNLPNLGYRLIPSNRAC